MVLRPDGQRLRPHPRPNDLGSSRMSLRLRPDRADWDRAFRRQPGRMASEVTSSGNRILSEGSPTR
jgi:hypothetical protein